jgi:hypothetical protein
MKRITTARLKYEQQRRQPRMLDIGSQNPRMQCTICGQWKRLHGRVNGEQIQRFFGSCDFTGDEHLAGHGDVCHECCGTRCKELKT